MKKTKYLRLILDIILTVSLLTLFSKRLFGMFYHEVVGLAVLLPILIHILINLKMIRGMSKNFKKVPMNVKLCLIVDVLLLLVFIWMGISGILISKTILTGISTSNVLVKLLHISMGGLSVILLGIHIGLHICRKEMQTGLAILITVIVLAGGIYGICSSEIVRWISMPFAIATNSISEENREMPMHGNKNDLYEHDIDNHNRGNGEGLGKGSGLKNGFGKEPGNGMGKGAGKGVGNGGHDEGQMNIWQKINVLVQFFGMMFSCAMLTYWIVICNKKRTQKKVRYEV